eukprot:4097184-Pleurochrysis_carterae.AAC.2
MHATDAHAHARARTRTRICAHACTTACRRRSRTRRTSVRAVARVVSSARELHISHLEMSEIRIDCAPRTQNAVSTKTKRYKKMCYAAPPPQYPCDAESHRHHRRRCHQAKPAPRPPHNRSTPLPRPRARLQRLEQCPLPAREEQQHRRSKLQVNSAHETPPESRLQSAGRRRELRVRSRRHHRAASRVDLKRCRCWTLVRLRRDCAADCTGGVAAAVTASGEASLRIRNRKAQNWMRSDACARESACAAAAAERPSCIKEWRCFATRRFRDIAASATHRIGDDDDALRNACVEIGERSGAIPAWREILSHGARFGGGLIQSDVLRDRGSGRRACTRAASPPPPPATEQKLKYSALNLQCRLQLHRWQLD